MKVSNSRRAHRYFDRVRNTIDHFEDPVVPENPGPAHAYLFDPKNPRPGQGWIQKHVSAPAFLEDGAEQSACGKGIRTIYPTAFDTDDSDACPRCIEMSLLWETDPAEFRRRVAERHQRWREREDRRWDAIDHDDYLRQESYGTEPIGDEE
jgi:hypothetical protein